jgi:hypothetical protein
MFLLSGRGMAWRPNTQGVYYRSAANWYDIFTVSSDSRQIQKILAFYRSYGFKLWHVELYK